MVLPPGPGGERGSRRAPEGLEAGPPVATQAESRGARKEDAPSPTFDSDGTAPPDDVDAAKHDQPPDTVRRPGWRVVSPTERVWVLLTPPNRAE
jgi:hypothetical protein